jgi:predicted nucleotidyltransferase
MIRFKKLPGNVRITSLPEFFDSQPNIVFAYIFGGFLKKPRNPLSDIDIAVYVKDFRKADYLGLFSKITAVLGTDEVDLVILNTAPISLAGRILQNRKVLADKEPFLRHMYESVTLRKYFDFAVKERTILQRRYKVG